MTDNEDRSSPPTYIGSADLHDATVQSLKVEGERATVHVLALSDREERVADRHMLLEFSGVTDVVAERVPGMMLYGLAELESKGPHRRFVFVNWDDDDSAQLEITARDVAFTYFS